MATSIARRGRPRFCATCTITEALFICAWLRPATGRTVVTLGFGFGFGVDDGVTGGFDGTRRSARVTAGVRASIAASRATGAGAGG